MAQKIVIAVFIRLWPFTVPLLLQAICKGVSCNILGQSLSLTVQYNVQSCSLSQIYVYVAELFLASVATELFQAFFADQNWVR